MLTATFALGGGAAVRSASADGAGELELTVAPTLPIAFDNDAWRNVLSDKGALGSYHRPDGTMVVVVPSSGSSDFRSADASAFGLQVAIEQRDIEQTDIATIKDIVSKSKWIPAAGNVAPFAGFIPRLGKVAVLTDAPRSEFADLLALYGSKIEWVGRSISFLSRHADASPHWGGAEMDGPDAGSLYDCTSGFSVTTSRGLSRMVTASHCFNLGDAMTSPASNTFGTVVRRENFPTQDFELVGGSGATMDGRIYCKYSATSTCPVWSTGANPNFSNLYCFSGATSWEQCQQDLIDDDFLACHNPPACTLTTPHLQWFDGPVGYGACPGDSGSPWYRYYLGDLVQIVGLTSLGEDWDGNITACLQLAQWSWAEKWTKIRDAYNVTIKTAS